METLKQIEALLKYLRDDERYGKMTCDELSRAEIKIAILMASLAEDISEARRIVNDKNAMLKFKTAEEAFRAKEDFINREIKPTIPDIANTVEMKIKEDRLEENKATKTAEKLVKLWEAMEKIINALKDRLKVMMREQELSKDF